MAMWWRRQKLRNGNTITWLGNGMPATGWKLRRERAQLRNNTATTWQRGNMTNAAT